MNILVVDDEKEIADLLEVYLSNEGYNVIKTYNSLEVLDLVKEYKIDLALIDIMMPKLDGFSLVLKLRESYNFPIIMVTAKVEDIDKVQGLTVGADDYIVKPFKPLELLARVKAHLRRYKNYNVVQDENVITVKDLIINKDTYECSLNDQALSLTPTEFSILWALMKHKGNVIKSDDLFQMVWNEKYFESSNNTIMVHIRHLREKMKDTKENPEYIKTVWGVGYKIDEK